MFFFPIFITKDPAICKIVQVKSTIEDPNLTEHICIIFWINNCLQEKLRLAAADWLNRKLDWQFEKEK